MGDKLRASELEAAKSQPVYEPGKAYLFVLTFGWAVVGYYVDRPDPLTIRVMHCNHFRNAGKDYGRLIAEGGGRECEWRYEGLARLSVPHVIRVADYHGEVPSGPIRR